MAACARNHGLAPSTSIGNRCVLALTQHSAMLKSHATVHYILTGTFNTLFLVSLKPNLGKLASSPSTSRAVFARFQPDAVDTHCPQDNTSRRAASIHCSRCRSLNSLCYDMGSATNVECLAGAGRWSNRN